MWLSSGVDIERLRRLPLFGELDSHDLSIVARWAKEVDVAGGDLLFEQGAMPYGLFVIERGEAEVTHDGAHVATLGPGDVVGEMALLKLERRWGSVRAVGDLHAVSLDVDGLAAIADEMPEVAERLRETMVRRDRENEAGADGP
jgi:CRP/FNR family transcriptional regulator, cyclic AMP receptor protein